MAVFWHLVFLQRDLFLAARRFQIDELFKWPLTNTENEAALRLLIERPSFVLGRALCSKGHNSARRYRLSIYSDYPLPLA